MPTIPVPTISRPEAGTPAPEGQVCEFCNKDDGDIRVEQIGLYAWGWSCKKCRKLGEVVNSLEEKGTIRYSKKKKRLTEETQPPSRQWLVFSHRRQMWEQMVKLHGIAIDKLDEHDELSQWEKDLIKEFGYYRNNPTLGQFRCKDGSVIEGDGEEVEMSLFND